jgi:hypothetical protein
MNELVKKVEEGSYTVPTSLSKEMVSFLNGMLQYKGEDRLSSEELSRHPFLTKNIREFQKIDIRRVQKKINSNGLNINVKKNQTIWSIFNEEDEKKLSQIKASDYDAAPLRQISQANDTKRRNTDGNLQRLQLNNINQQYNKANTNNFNYPGQNCSIYGQNMKPNPVQVMPQYPMLNQKPMTPYISKPQPQASNSKGMGKYNSPTLNSINPNIEELIDLSQPIKKIDDATSNILITNENVPKILYGDSKGVIHVIYDLDFRNEYQIKEFNNIIRCIIQLSSLIAAGSNDCKVKLFSIGIRNYKVIKEIQDNAEIWALRQIGGNIDFVIGNNIGYFYKCKNKGKDYEIQKRFKMVGSSVLKSILNIVDLSDSVVMIIYFRDGAYFFDFNTSEKVGYIPHEYFNPFRCATLKISDHELLIGAEFSIFLIDYKKFQKIKEFKNDASYALFKLSEQYLLTSYGQGFLQTYKMSRDKDGQLELKYVKKNKIINDIVAGIVRLPDDRFMIFASNDKITVWNSKINLNKINMLTEFN